MGDKYEIREEIKEEKVYVVYKNDSRDKSFPTLEKAEEYKRQKEEEMSDPKREELKKRLKLIKEKITILRTDLDKILGEVESCLRINDGDGYDKKKPNFYAKLDAFFRNKKTGKPNFLKIILTLLALIIYIILTIWLQKKNKILGYVLAILGQIFISLFYMLVSIPITVNKKNEGKKTMAFVTNLIFILSTSMFIFNTTYFNHIWFQIISLIILFIMICFIYIFVEIEKGADLSTLKAINYIMASIFTAIILLNVKSIDNKNIACNVEKMQNFMKFYYIVPLMMLQGLYELLGKKSRKLNDCPNSEVEKNE